MYIKNIYVDTSFISCPKKISLFSYFCLRFYLLPMYWLRLNHAKLFVQVYPHGSTDSLPFCTMGSGSLNAMAVFEAEYKDDMTLEEASALVARAIRFGTCHRYPCIHETLSAHTTCPVIWFSILNMTFFETLILFFLILILKINCFRDDLSDVSVRTKILRGSGKDRLQCGFFQN